MAVRVGDLWPFASGTSSLGAEMANGGFTGAIVPFANIHSNSGVFHRQSGGSGVIRFGNQGLEFSDDGGINWNLLSDVTAILTLLDNSGSATSDQNIQLTTTNGVVSQLVDTSTINFDVLVQGVNGIVASHPTPGVTIVNGSALSGFVTLQNAYNNKHTIATSLVEGGPVFISGVDQSALRIAVAEKQGVHIELSGVIASPTLFNHQGGLLLAIHSHNLGDPFLATATEASVKASSPGLPTLWMNMGSSGVAAVRVASGIAQFFNTTSSDPITDTGFNINFPLVGQSNPDTFFRSIAQSGIKINVDGLYKVMYTVSINKTLGNLGQQCNSSIRVNDQWGNTFLILGTISYAQVRNSSSLSRNTANGQGIFDLNAGEIVNLNVKASTAVSPPEEMLISSREANLILEYLGPQRGNSSLRSAV